MQTFDFAAVLPRRTNSSNTQRAYYRWVDRYLSDVAGLASMQGEARLKRMQNLPLRGLQKNLTARKLKNWLNRLVEEGQGRQGLDQARATIVTLADLMAAEGLLDSAVAAEIQAVSVPLVKKKNTPERLLTADEIKQLMAASHDMATSSQQALRNHAVSIMLCTMALRREELSAAKWAHLVARHGQVFLAVGNNDFVDVPRPVLTTLDRWRHVVVDPVPHSPLIRRIWKGGRIAKAGLSPDGIWLIIRNAAQYAGLEHVTPDDLRRSAVANMYRAGMPVEEISRVLRHRSVLITERFLAKLSLSDLNSDLG